MTLDQIKGILFGLAIGDALGVPVEFKPRHYLKENPVTDMLAYGSHNQPKGTWSDDSSLAFCLAEMIAKEYDIQDLAHRMIHWKEHAYWTPHGEVFDIGIATSTAIHELYIGKQPKYSGGVHEQSNGNGSLMRILPLLVHIKDMNIEKRYQFVDEVSRITHAHIRSIFSCFIYLEFARELLSERDKMKAFHKTQETVNAFWKERDIITEAEINKFHRILCNPIGDYAILPIYKFTENEIGSSGYVIDTLEAAFWSFLTTDNYSDAVLKAINLGNDTDTTGCVVGGIAGLFYGFASIPNHWIETLARKNDIEILCNKLFNHEQHQNKRNK